MARAKENPEIEHRIDCGIVVDCYDEAERQAGWTCHLEERLSFPCQMRCRHPLPESPLRPGEVVTATGLLEERPLAGIWVRIRWRERELAVPLAQVEGVGLSAEAAQAVADWHYWCARGYGF